jgi:hypothetical protein
MLMCEGNNPPSVSNCRASQGSLYVIIKRYKKWAPLVLPILINALKSADIDTVKGALHTLRLGTVEHTLARNWEYTDKYVLAIFEAWENYDRVFPLKYI